MNWLDLIIILGVILGAYIGLRNGFVFGLIELVGIVVSICIPLLIWEPVAQLFGSLGVPKRFSGMVGFVVVLILVMMVYYKSTSALYKKVQEALLKSKVNSYLGTIPGVIQGAIVIAMLVTLVAVSPGSIVNEKTISGSYFAQIMLDKTMHMAESANKLFGSAIHEAMGFMTPSAEETIDLGHRTTDVEIDIQAENEMLALVNQERINRGIPPLVMDPTIRAVARRYSVYMLENGFFSHTGLDGSTPLKRMLYGGVQFNVMGENLAYAPTVKMAHNGLMSSPGHRANILNPKFKRIGIGVARAGRYRLMFTQNFAG